MNSLRASAKARISSSSFSCVAFEDLLALFWITNTIQKVTTVVVVLMNSCHVSENRNSGPVRAQMTTSRTDPASAGNEPSAIVTESAIALNRSPRVLGDGVPVVLLVVAAVTDASSGPADVIATRGTAVRRAVPRPSIRRDSGHGHRRTDDRRFGPATARATVGRANRRCQRGGRLAWRAGQGRSGASDRCREP